MLSKGELEQLEREENKCAFMINVTHMMNVFQVTDFLLLFKHKHAKFKERAEQFKSPNVDLKTFPEEAMTQLNYCVMEVEDIVYKEWHPCTLTMASISHDTVEPIVQAKARHIAEMLGYE